jgi:hypothetical protein
MTATHFCADCELCRYTEHKKAEEKEKEEKDKFVVSQSVRKAKELWWDNHNSCVQENREKKSRTSAYGTHEG